MSVESVFWNMTWLLVLIFIWSQSSSVNVVYIWLTNSILLFPATCRWHGLSESGLASFYVSVFKLFSDEDSLERVDALNLSVEGCGIEKKN